MKPIDIGGILVLHNTGGYTTYGDEICRIVKLMVGWCDCTMGNLPYRLYWEHGATEPRLEWSN